jgi:hypothetical protein
LAKIVRERAVVRILELSWNFYYYTTTSNVKDRIEGGRKEAGGVSEAQLSAAKVVP